LLIESLWLFFNIFLFAEEEEVTMFRNFLALTKILETLKKAWVNSLVVTVRY